MQVSTMLLVASVWLPISSHAAAQNWEICLDKADFSFNVDGFVGSSTVSKTGCEIKVAHSGGKGEKFLVNLCDSSIHIDHFAAIDATNSRRIVAGSTGCPGPLFGADFEENAQSFNEYRDMRKRVFEHWAKVKGVYGEGADKVNLSNPNSFSPEVSAGKIACGQYLLDEYLNKCMAFEAPSTIHPAKK